MLGAAILNQSKESENVADTERSEFMRKQAAKFIYRTDQIDYEDLKKIHLILLKQTRRIRSLLACLMAIGM